MALEAGTWVDDLVITNPPGTDQKRQGDDHLRLLKTVLKNTFKRATKAFYFPGTISKSGNYTVLDTDENLTIACDTTSAFTLTLPVLDATRAGWQIFVLKTTTDANPVYITPSSGTINGYTKIRRSQEFAPTRVLWTGSVWVATRPNGTPIGTTQSYYGATLPNGYLWPDGNTFAAADYVELNTALGGNTKPDVRERAQFGRDNLGTVSRITSGGSGINGDTLKATGGEETHVLLTTELAVHGHGVTDPTHAHGTTDPQHVHPVPYQTVSINNPGAGTPTTVVSGIGSGANVPNTNPASTGLSINTASIGITINNAGSNAAHNNMPPAIICNMILVAE